MVLNGTFLIRTMPLLGYVSLYATVKNNHFGNKLPVATKTADWQFSRTSC